MAKTSHARAGRHAGQGAIRESFSRRLNVRDAFGQLFDMLPEVYFFAKDADGRFVRMNLALVRALGLHDEAEVLGRDDYDFFSREMADRYRAEDQRVMRGDRPVCNEIWVVPNRAGVLTWYVSSKIPLHDHRGRIIGIAGAMRELRTAGPGLGPYEPLAPAIQHLTAHFAQPVTLSELAARVHLSVSQFQRRFRELFRTSPMQYVIQFRVQQACRDLERTGRTIAEIALANGFYDQSCFVRQFRARLGMTPTAYRRRHRAAPGAVAKSRSRAGRRTDKSLSR